MLKDRHEGFVHTGIVTFMESDYIQDITASKVYDVAFIGVPTDIGVSYRRGAMYGPQAIREFSMWEKLNGKDYVDTESGETRKTNEYTICDFGDIFLSRASVEEAHKTIHQTIKDVRSRMFPLIVGGDHSIAYSTIRGCIDASGIPKEKIGILHIDAHCDTEDECLGLHKYHHGAPFKLLIEEGHIKGENLFTIGPRGMLPAYQIQYAKERGINLHLMSNIRAKGFDAFLEELLLDLQKFEAIYVTLDMDGIDPIDVKGTGTPVEGGFRAHEIQQLVRSLKELKIIGFEMVELAPEFDPSGYSTIVALNILWQFLAFGLTLEKVGK